MLGIYLFVPNLIGYVRVVLNLSAFFVMLHKPYLTVALHFAGGLFLDVVDGVTARYFNQCSRFGDLLDMLLDRCGRIGMLMGLCVLYPQHLFAFQLLVCLEVAGCWSNHFRCALRSNPNYNTFQKIRNADPWILRIFFQEPIITLVIFGQDMCVYMCYLLYFSSGPTVSFAGFSHSLWRVLAWICAPFLIYRSFWLKYSLNAYITEPCQWIRLLHVKDLTGQTKSLNMMQVYFYVPNLIDYARVVLNLAAFYNMLHKPYLTVALHFTGNLFLDCLDGITARALDQCSKFGDLLDKLLDRCGRIGMLMGLCVLYPQHLFVLQLLVCLEVAGPWANHYRRILRSDPNHNFQHVSPDPWIVRTYFEEPILTLIIFGQDVCVYMCYLLYFSSGPTVSLAGSSLSLWEVLAWLGAPFLIYRQFAVQVFVLITLFHELAQLHHHQDTGRKKA